MTAPRKPQDRKPKSQKQRDRAETFTFSYGGESYTMPSIETLPPGFLRKIRDKSEIQQMFDSLEFLADDESATDGILDVVDNLSHDEFEEFVVAFMSSEDISLGESSAS